MLRRAFVLVCLLAIPLGAAQVPPVYQFDVAVETTNFDMTDLTELIVPITFYDLSKDSSNTVAPGTGFSPEQHITKFRITYNNEDNLGFFVQPPVGSISSQGGEVYTKAMRIQVNPFQIQQEQYSFSVFALTETQNGTYTQRIDFNVRTPGPATFNARGVFAGEIRPDTVQSFNLELANFATIPRTFTIEETDNPCNMGTAYPRQVTLEGKEVRAMQVDFRAPSDKFLYLSEGCSLGFIVTPTDGGVGKPILINTQVNGAYVDPVWVFYALAAATALAILLFVLARRKAIIEEEILGKPQRPWTIPVERVYLEHLEARDPRAAYVVRHFLMEEEYRSALLWYRSFKTATKGTRAKETLVVAQENAYERFKNKWQKKIDRPIKKADRFEAKLQRKLDRRAKADVRKERRSWKKNVAKAEARHEKRSAKLLAAWEKASKKAAKRGEAAPPKPEIGEPDVPAKPEIQKVLLADTKLQKRADRMRSRMVKKQGNLDVRFEKKDARRLAKVRRKVNKIARKIDDPEFAEEHPLLTGDA